MAEVLGRVVHGDLGRPRGPDATHRIRVPRAWLRHGALVELELPRHLICAVCGGGGCDVCERSGGVTLRERGAPAEIVQVTLPADRSQAFVIRLPERGGLPAEGAGLPRGNLLLRVEPSTEADASVTLVRPPATSAIRRSLAPLVDPPRRSKLALVLGALVLGGLLVAIWLLLRR